MSAALTWPRILIHLLPQHAYALHDSTPRARNPLSVEKAEAINRAETTSDLLAGTSAPTEPGQDSKTD